jgi:hypothetical protein
MEYKESVSRSLNILLDSGKNYASNVHKVKFNNSRNGGIMNKTKHLLHKTDYFHILVNASVV